MEAAARRDLRLRLVTEILTGEPQEDVFVNAVLQRGVDGEPLARGAYEAFSGHLVQESGFLSADEMAVGCSLDGHVGNFEGIVEIKCPKSATHLRWLRQDGVPFEHMPQITHNLWISGAAWCDFVSWDDRFPPELSLLVRRVCAADLDIDGYARKAAAFLEEVQTEVAALRGLGVLA